MRYHRSMRLPASVAVVLAVFASLSVAAQQAAPVRADGAISGVVVDATSGQPVGDATVGLRLELPGAPGAQSQLTDRQGRFVFTDLVAGENYAIRVTRSGFSDSAYGAVSPASHHSAPIALAAGQWLKDLKISMWRFGGISGTVTDERGEPMIGVAVRAIGFTKVAGLDQPMAGPMAVTDDRGDYRIGRLPPGMYVVCVPNVQMSIPASAIRGEVAARLRPAGGDTAWGESLRALASSSSAASVQVIPATLYPLLPPSTDGQLRVYPLTFAGGATTMAQARTVNLEPGAEQANVDVRLLPVAAVRVTGRLEGPPSAVADRTVRLLPAGLEELGFGSEVATSLADGDGNFSFEIVPAGSYVVDVPAIVSQYQVSSPMVMSAIHPVLPLPVGVQPSTVSFGQTSWGPPGVDLARWTIALDSTGRMPLVVGGAPPTPVTVPVQASAIVRGKVEFDLDPTFPFRPDDTRYVSLDDADGTARLGTPGNVRQLPSPRRRDRDRGASWHVCLSRV